MIEQGARERHGPAAETIEVLLGPAQDEFLGELGLAAVPHITDIAQPARERGASFQTPLALAHAVIDGRPGNPWTIDDGTVVAVRPVAGDGVMRISPSKHILERKLGHDHPRVLDAA